MMDIPETAVIPEEVQHAKDVITSHSDDYQKAQEWLSKALPGDFQQVDVLIYVSSQKALQVIFIPNGKEGIARLEGKKLPSDYTMFQWQGLDIRDAMTYAGGVYVTMLLLDPGAQVVMDIKRHVEEVKQPKFI